VIVHTITAPFHVTDCAVFVHHAIWTDVNSIRCVVATVLGTRAVTLGIVPTFVATTLAWMSAHCPCDVSLQKVQREKRNTGRPHSNINPSIFAFSLKKGKRKRKKRKRKKEKEKEKKEKKRKRKEKEKERKKEKKRKREKEKKRKREKEKKRKERGM